jgi:CheY-like chemotaxis protein
MKFNEQIVLLVEDREEDLFLLQYAFKRAAITAPLRVVFDGQQAIEYLSGTGAYADRRQFPLPDLVLMDLKLPAKTGLEVLAWIRRQPELKQLIVIVLSSSISERDLREAYELGANAFLVKPPDANQLFDMAKAIQHFWLVHNRSASDRSPRGFIRPVATESAPRPQ